MTKSDDSPVALMDGQELLSGAAPESLDRLRSVVAVRRVGRDEHVFYDKDQVPAVYLAASGLLSIYKLSPQGEKKIIFVLGPGSLLNESLTEDRPASASCEAREDSVLLCFPKKKFLEVLKHDFTLATVFMDALSLKVRRLYRQLKNTTGAVRGDRRTAAKLWKLAHDYGAPTERGVRIDMRLTVTSLAEMLGSKRETLSRQLKLLSELKLLTVVDGQFIIPDPGKLAEYFKKAD